VVAPQPTLSIQQTAEQTGLSVDTLRYYERIGLLAPTRDASSHHRRYSQMDLVWIAFLSKLRSTGMPLLEIRDYINLYRQGDDTVAQRKALLENHALQVAQQITQLQSSLQVIQQKIDHLNQYPAAPGSSSQETEL
jgi:DNA-binding transcriptional MerR regulator